MKGKSAHLVNIPEASTSSTGEADYYNEHGDPVYAHMANVQDNKHLIRFLISVDSVENSKCPTVLLKTDTEVDMNLMNSDTFDKLIQDRTVLQPTSLRMEAYGKAYGSDCARKVPCLSQMEGLCLQTVVLFNHHEYIT